MSAPSARRTGRASFRSRRHSLMAPSGVLMIGIALVLRDLVQRRLGVIYSASAVIVGAILSALVAPPSLVLASGVAFLLSEFADLAVYTPLARRRLVAAVVASSLVGLVVDSIIFLWLAFGSLEFLAGQVVGKAWMVLLSIPFVLVSAPPRRAARPDAGLTGNRSAATPARDDVLHPVQDARNSHGPIERAWHPRAGRAHPPAHALGAGRPPPFDLLSGAVSGGGLVCRSAAR